MLDFRFYLLDIIYYISYITCYVLYIIHYTLYIIYYICDVYTMIAHKESTILHFLSHFGSNNTEYRKCGSFCSSIISQYQNYKTQKFPFPELISYEKPHTDQCWHLKQPKTNIFSRPPAPDRNCPP